MYRRITLICIMFAYCSVDKCRATVTWTTASGPLPIPESTSKDNLTVFVAPEATNFTILSQNVTGQFAITSNGTLSSTNELDFESGDILFSLEIMAFAAVATDNANHSFVIQVTDVNDEKPQFPKTPYSVNFPNNVAKGDSLLNVTATDKDVTATFKKVVYTIKGNDAANFTIDADTGNIKAANKLTGPHTFKLIVVATDNNSSTFSDQAIVSMCINGCTPSGSSALEKSMFAFLTALVFNIVLM